MQSKRMSDEELMIRILKILVEAYKNNQLNLSTYEIVQSITQRSQKQERVKRILIHLESRKLVECISVKRANYYKITENGIRLFPSFLKTFRALISEDFLE